MSILKLKRKVGESITIAGNIVITVARTGSMAVHLIVDAPLDISIARTELLTKKESKEETQ